MIAVLCLDDMEGMLFHERRQSRDRKVTEKILELAEGSRLWIHPFSQPLFAKCAAGNLTVDERFLEEAEEGEYCFVENQGLGAWENRLEKIVIFRWNRHYPADFYLDICLERWKKTGEEEFAGYSHEKITREVYEK